MEMCCYCKERKALETEEPEPPMCRKCLRAYEKASVPRLNLLDRMIIRLLGKSAKYRYRKTGGFDPYAGHELTFMKFGHSFRVTNVIDWGLYIDGRFYNIDDWQCKIAIRIFKAFEEREAVWDYNTPENAYDYYGSNQ